MEALTKFAFNKKKALLLNFVNIFHKNIYMYVKHRMMERK